MLSRGLAVLFVLLGGVLLLARPGRTSTPPKQPAKLALASAPVTKQWVRRSQQPADAWYSEYYWHLDVLMAVDGR